MEPTGHASGERLIYVMPEQTLDGTASNISLRELWSILWREKLLIVAVTVAFSIGSVAYVLLATEWFRAEALLAPVKQRANSALAGQFGGLAALAGVSMGGGDSIESVATLNSREFARAFIEDLNLLPVFFSDQWDPNQNHWLDDDPEEWPDVRDAVKYFHDYVLNVSEDRQTGLVTLSIEWTDAEIAASWAETLVHRLNASLRERALQEAEANVAYLQAELTQTSVVTLQQSIGRLLESELEKVMLARGNEEFAFRVIDPAATPKERARPKRALIAVLGTLLGGMLGVFGVFLAHGVRSDPSSPLQKNLPL